jgi:hypothetical protein
MRRVDTLASMNPLMTHGNAFMGKISIFSSAMVVMIREGVRSMCSNTVVVKVMKGTMTGVQAHRNTHRESRYFLIDK